MPPSGIEGRARAGLPWLRLQLPRDLHHLSSSHLDALRRWVTQGLPCWQLSALSRFPWRLAPLLLGSPACSLLPGCSSLRLRLPRAFVLLVPVCKPSSCLALLKALSVSWLASCPEITSRLLALPVRLSSPSAILTRPLAPSVSLAARLSFCLSNSFLLVVLPLMTPVLCLPSGDRRPFPLISSRPLSLPARRAKPVVPFSGLPHVVDALGGRSIAPRFSFMLLVLLPMVAAEIAWFLLLRSDIPPWAPSSGPLMLRASRVSSLGLLLLPVCARLSLTRAARSPSAFLPHGPLALSARPVPRFLVGLFTLLFLHGPLALSA